MTQVYSNPKRESEPYALPDVEVFYVHLIDADDFAEDGNGIDGPGWYYWYCFPGCLPDGMALGPFDSEAEAIADARSESEEDEDNGEK